MKNKWRILKILITVILFGFLLSFSLKRFNNASMEKISVRLIAPQGKEKVYFIDEKDVKQFIQQSNPTKRIGDIDIPHLEKEVEHFPSVDSANVYLNLNGNLNVDIVQKVPAFRLLKDGQNFYVDAKGNEFPVSKNYSHPSMLVMGDVGRNEYVKLAELVDKINKDDFSRKYFIGIAKEKGSYNLLTSEGNYKVEIGDLENIDFKVKGFQTFVEKYLIYQEPEKYSKISVKYDNQIVTTLNPNFEANDSIIQVGHKELAKIPELTKKKEQATASSGVLKIPEKTKTVKPKPAAQKKTEQKKETAPSKKTVQKTETKKPAANTKTLKPAKKETAKKPVAAEKKPTKPKAKVKIE